MTSRAPAAWLHAGFTVDSLDRLLPFLCDCLGFRVVSDGRPAVPGILARIVGVAGADARIANVRLGAHVLELVEYTAPADRARVDARPVDVGFAHLALEVEDVGAYVAAAAEYGFHPAAPPVAIPAGPNAGKHAVYLRDRSGFTVELIGRDAGRP